MTETNPDERQPRLAEELAKIPYEPLLLQWDLGGREMSTISTLSVNLVHKKLEASARCGSLSY